MEELGVESGSSLIYNSKRRDHTRVPYDLREETRRVLEERFGNTPSPVCKNLADTVKYWP